MNKTNNAVFSTNSTENPMGVEGGVYIDFDFLIGLVQYESFYIN